MKFIGSYRRTQFSFGFGPQEGEMGDVRIVTNRFEAEDPMVMRRLVTAEHPLSRLTRWRRNWAVQVQRLMRRCSFMMRYVGVARWISWSRRAIDAVHGPRNLVLIEALILERKNARRRIYPESILPLAGAGVPSEAFNRVSSDGAENLPDIILQKGDTVVFRLRFEAAARWIGTILGWTAREGDRMPSRAGKIFNP